MDGILQRSSHFDFYYNVQSTPMVYILDKNKKIIAKKLAVEDIGSFIDNYRKYCQIGLISSLLRPTYQFIN